VERFDSVIRGGRMDSGFYQTFMGYALEGNRDSHRFTLTNAYKDLKYLESMANAATVATPLASAAKMLMPQLLRLAATVRKTTSRIWPILSQRRMAFSS
jgi:3-hydroxyisobutyrate dehydrogenase-like beta-hydroxyacid dehydrogenase